ncbi:MAG: hypothetical protein AAGC57_20710 [Pseudomonadota bacterium]
MTDPTTNPPSVDDVKEDIRSALDHFKAALAEARQGLAKAKAGFASLLTVGGFLAGQATAEWANLVTEFLSLFGGG